MPTPAMMATMAVEMRASLSLVKSIVVYWMGGVSGEAVWMRGGVWCCVVVALLCCRQATSVVLIDMTNFMPIIGEYLKILLFREY